MSRPATILLATRSADKVREIRAIFAAASALNIISLDEAGFASDPDEEEIERYDSFRENALAKARFFAERASLPTVADDSGLVVDALGGLPGVRSKRFALSSASGAALDHANNQELLRRLGDAPPRERTAHYVCAAALVSESGRHVLAIGTCRGVILHTPRGDGGFGYDPLFLIPALDATFGELSLEQKNARSHRARAFRALRAAAP